MLKEIPLRRKSLWLWLIREFPISLASRNLCSSNYFYPHFTSSFCCIDKWFGVVGSSTSEGAMSGCSVYSSSNDKILEQCKLKAFVDGKINWTE